MSSFPFESSFAGSYFSSLPVVSECHFAPRLACGAHLFTFTLFNLTENLEHNIPFPAVTRIDSGGRHISVGEDMSIELLPTLQNQYPLPF
jgi:hypothetical protein